MLKKELAELVKALKDDDKIDDAISKSDLGKTLVNSGLTLENFKSKLENDSSFKSFMDSENEKHFSKALETWKTNNLPKLIDDEYKKKHPDADPKDTKIAEMEKKIEQMQKDTARKELTNKALKVAQEKKLPTELIDYFVGSDENTTKANLKTLTDVLGKHDEALKTEILKDTYKPGGKGGAEPTEEAVQAQVNSIFGLKQ